MARPTTQIAALKTHQIDGVTTDSVTVYKFVETGDGRILVKFGDYFKDFVVQLSSMPATISSQSKPDALRAFLAGWFETIVFMRDHKAEHHRHCRQADRRVAWRRRREL